MRRGLAIAAARYVNNRGQLINLNRAIAVSQQYSISYYQTPNRINVTSRSAAV